MNAKPAPALIEGARPFCSIVAGWMIHVIVPNLVTCLAMRRYPSGSYRVSSL